MPTVGLGPQLQRFHSHQSGTALFPGVKRPWSKDRLGTMSKRAQSRARGCPFPLGHKGARLAPASRWQPQTFLLGVQPSATVGLAGQGGTQPCPRAPPRGTEDARTEENALPLADCSCAQNLVEFVETCLQLNPSILRHSNAGCHGHR